MAGNAFNASPLDNAIVDAEARRKAAEAAADGIGLPERPKLTTSVPDAGTGEIPFQAAFEAAAKKYKVPVNVLLALGEQESRFDPKAVNAETNATGVMQYIPATAKALGIDPTDPVQSIEAAARQYAERINKGMSPADAIKEHFAGPDRNLWGPKTEVYGREVIERAKRFGQLYKSRKPAEEAPAAEPTASDIAAGVDAKNAGNVDPRFVSGTPENMANANRTWSELANDSRLAVAQGVIGMVGGFAWLGNKLGLGDGETARQAFGFQKWAEEQKSAKAQGANKLVEQADGFVDTLAAMIDNPVSILDQVVQSAPMAIPGVGAGAAAARGTSILAARKGMTELAKREAARRAAAAGAIAAESITAGGMGGNETYQTILSTDPAVLREKSARFRELESAMGEKLAREQLADEVALTSGTLQAAATAAGGVIGNKINKAIGLDGDPVAGAVVDPFTGKQVAKNIAGEVVQETVQEPGAQVGENAAMQRADNTVGLMDNVGDAAAMGAIGAFGQAGATNAARGAFELARGQSPAAGGISPDGAPAPAGPEPAPAPEAAAPKPNGPLTRSLEKVAPPPAAAAPGDAVDQSDLGDVLDSAIARGDAAQIDADGNQLAEQAQEAAAAPDPALPAAAAMGGLDSPDGYDFREERKRALAAKQQAQAAQPSAAAAMDALKQKKQQSNGRYKPTVSDYDEETIGTLERDIAALSDADLLRAEGNPVRDFILDAKKEWAGEANRRLNDETIPKDQIDSAMDAADATYERLKDLWNGYAARRDAARARRKQAAAEKSQAETTRAPIAGKPVKQDKAVTPAGREVDVEYRVVEASDLVTSNDDAGNVNPAYPQSLQPRDRTRATSELQINDIAANLNPRLMTEGPTTADGAPVVSPEGVVESGNGRTLAIRRAYARNPESAERYRQHLADMGIDTADMKQPVLVRVRQTAMDGEDLVNYTRESNERTTLAMGAPERAKADAKAIPAIIEDYKGGDLAHAGNRDFVRKFIRDAVSKTDQAQMVDAGGELTQDGRRRIEAAILSSAYGDGALVADLFESSDSDIKSIGGALMDAAPQWAKMRSAAETLAEGMDVTPNLLEAVAIVRRARAEGKRVSELVNNGDMFKGDVDQMTRDFLRVFFRGDSMAQARSRKVVSEALNEYVTQALETKAGPGLFGDDLPTTTAKDIIGATNEKLERNEQQQASQSDFFGARTGSNEQGAGEPGGEGQRPQPAARNEAPAEGGQQGLTEGRPAQPAPAMTANGERIFQKKGPAAMRAAQLTKSTGTKHEPSQVDGGWIVQPVGQKAEPAGERRAAPADGEPRERRVPGRTPPVSARDVWHDKLAEDVRKDEEGSETYSSLPADVRRKINDERLAARMKGEPLPIDPTSGLIDGKAVIEKDATEQGTAKGTMLEGMLNAAVNHVKAGGKAHVAELDLGNLGGINHFSGQVGGDRAIADVSSAIRKAADDAGLADAVDLARYGGDEFFMVARNGDSGAIGQALAAANKAVQEYMSKATPRTLNPGLEAEVNGMAITAEEKADLLRFIDTPLAKLPKKPVTKPNGEKEYLPGKTKIHVGNLVEVAPDATAAALHAAADSSLAMAKNANYKEKANEQATDELAGVRGDAERGAQGAAGREDRAGRSAPDADRAVVEDDGKRAPGGREVAAGVEGAAGQVSLRGRAVGEQFADANGTVYRIDGADVQSGLIKLIKDPDQLSERAVFKDQAGFDKLLAENDSVLDAAGSGRFANNKLFTADKVAAARERLRKKLNGSQLNAGFDPEILTDGMTIAGAYIEEGIRDFSAFAKQMASDMGDNVRPYLLSFWEGARNFPGLDTDGMTDPSESARLHKELMAEKPVTPAAQEAIGTTVKKPKNTKKASGTAGDKRLRQDWGVDNIDGYAESDEFEGSEGTDWGVKGGVKDAFLKDAKTYMTAVASLLEAAGFEATRGKAVSSNPAGPAVSGDVSLSMKRDGVVVYATVGASSLRGVVPGTGAGVAVMFRAGKGSDTKGTNRWVSPDLPARDLAGLIVEEAGRAAAQQEKANEPRKLEGAGQGALAGAPSQGVPAAAAQGPAGAGADGRGRADAQGNDRAGGGGVQRAGGMGAGAGDAPVQTGGERAAGSRSAGPGAGAGNAGAAEQDAGPGVGERVAALPAQSRADDFTITGDDAIGEGGAKTKFNNNVAAIRLLKELQSQNRDATRDEQAVLAKYVGWGGIPQAFYREGGGTTSGWEKQAAELKELLTADEYAAAAASTQNAHYTAPEIVSWIWNAVQQLGFHKGRVLEPSVGVGNFFGLMPTDARTASHLVGVELDAITGGIAKLLYPAANVQSPVGFQDVNIPSNYFDLAIGNPPFGATKIYDGKRRDLNGLSIHNYFFAKSVDSLKPGGVLAMVVTNRFMDAADKKARRLITEKTELLGAIRLPNNAFLKNAGTEVTTDIIFLRKLQDGDTGNGESWMEVQDYTDKDGNTVPLNEYFLRHPEMMLGEFGAFGTMYRAGESALVAREGQNTGKLLEEAIARLPRNVLNAEAGNAPSIEVIAAANDIGTVKVGSMYAEGDKVMVRLEDELGAQRGREAEFPNVKAKERAVGMIAVRDALTDLRRLQLSNTATDAQIDAGRRTLNNAYDKFVDEFGPINQEANKRVFRDDPSWPQLSALEDDFDKGVSAAIAAKTGEKARKPSAKKAAIFTKRTQSPYQPPTSASTAKDALIASLAETGRVDMGYMGELYGHSEEHMAKELAGLIYRNPVGGWETKDDYLSGNVKQKLAVAEMAAEQEPKYRENVEALRAVQPPDVDSVDIDVKPGAHWLPPADMAAFADHIGGRTGASANYSPVNASWSIDLVPTSEASAIYGTNRSTVVEVVRAAANQKTIRVFDVMPDESRVLNEAATQAANEKVEKVKAEFRRWIWDDEDRRVRLTRLYNDTFNTDRQREYDGSHLAFPGKVGDDVVKLRPHQANAVWRAIQSPTTLFDHVVGAGKTFTMVGAAMEMRRMGLASKPMFVVPNHLVSQWAADFVKLYPGANILATSKKDFEKDSRKRLFSRIATGDWDAVIVAHSSFGKVGVTPEFESKFIKQQLADIETSLTALRAADGKSSRNVKQVEKAKAALEEKLKRLFDQDGKDDAIYFDELGVDALFLDEAHEFKNLQFSTSMQRVAGLGNPTGSQKAADMFMKVQQVMSRTGGRNIVFATGTPISNTMAEMFTMQRYLDYSVMREQGLAHFDAWARMYGEVVTDWELSPSGQYKMNSRFAKFVNMPELMQRYGSFADVINRDDINRMLASQGKTLPVPKVKGEKPQNVVVERSGDQAFYIGVPKVDENGHEEYPQGSLVWRAENLPKKAEKGADNMLKIMSDARKAALDMRLIDSSYPDNPGSKVNEAADRIVKLHQNWAKDKGAQLVFIDLSTPKSSRGAEAARIRELITKAEQGDEDAQTQLDKLSPDELLALDSDFSVYDDLKEKLIARGIPADEIAYIHDAKTDDAKAVLFGKVKTGRVRVLMGSTAKMGAGMNVQERLVALHHLDAPWRPSDLEQREGRIIRQGNALRDRDPDNFEVEILRYATKQTLDSRMWQTIEAKARFIEQVRKGMAGSREIEDIGGEAANSAEMKAASSGNPLILEEMDLRQKVRKLANEASEYDREQHRIRDMIRSKRNYVQAAAGTIANLTADQQRIPKEFSVTVGGKTYDKPKEAGVAIILKAAELQKQAGKKEMKIGSYGDFALHLSQEWNGTTVLSADAAGSYEVEIKDLNADPTGLALRLKNAVSAIPDEIIRVNARIESDEADIPKLEAQLKPWPKGEDLVQLKARHATVIDQLKPKKKEQPKPGEGEGKASIAKWYFSALERAAEAVKQETATADQWSSMLKKAPGVKSEELDATGVLEWLQAVGGKITKPQVIEFLRGNGVQIEEVMKTTDDADELPGDWDVVESEEEPGMWAVVDSDGEEVSHGETRAQAIENARDNDYAGTGPDDTKFSQYQLPGGKDYRELLLTLPDGDKKRQEKLDRINDEVNSLPPHGQRTDEQQRRFDALVVEHNAVADAPREESYRTSDWGEKNVIAHIRFNVRTGANGERILHIEEIQSDWAQEGRKKGFKGEFPEDVLKAAVAGGMTEEQARADIEHLMDNPTSTDERDTSAQWMRLNQAIPYGSGPDLNEVFHDRPKEAVPKAPFVSNTGAWSMLAMKRVISYAAENGYYAITWTGGEEQAARYDLSKQIDRVIYLDNSTGGIGLPKMDGPAGSGTLEAYDKNGRKVLDKEIDDPKEIEDYIGKDLAKKLIDTRPVASQRAGFGVRERALQGVDLKVGGQGMIGFYDKILPTETNKLLKKYGGKVEKIDVSRQDKDGNQDAGRYVLDAQDIGLPGDAQQEVIIRDSFTLDGVAEFDNINDAQAWLDKNDVPKATFQGFRLTPALRDQAAIGMPLFSRQQEKASGMTVEQVTKSISGAGLGSLLKSGKIVVHADSSKFPGKWKNIEGIQAVTMPDGTIHFSAAGVEPKDVVPALLHEAFHSDVYPLIGGAAWNKLQRELFALYRQGKRSGGKMREFWDKAAERVADAESVGIDLTDSGRAEEFGAYAIEEYEAAPAVVKGWVDRFTGLVKAWMLKRFGLQAGAVTPAQLRELAKMALRNAANGGPGGGGGVRASMRAVTESPAFKRWFGKSKVVDANGKPMVVYHGTDADFSEFADPGIMDYRRHPSAIIGNYFSRSPVAAHDFVSDYGDGANIMPVYLSLQNPYEMTWGEFRRRFAPESSRYSEPGDVEWDNIEEAAAEFRDRLEREGYDGVIVKPSKATDDREGKAGSFIAFRPEQIKSAFNGGQFDPTSPDIRASVRRPRLPLQEQPRNRFALPPETRGKKLQRIFQDRFNRVATVQRVVQEQGGTLSEASNVYQAEERYHGRVTARIEDFAEQELKPFIDAVAKADVTLDEVAEYAYAEHAPERNAYIGGINDRFADGNGSGMTDEEAAAVIEKFRAEGKADKLAALTKQMRDIAGGTRELIVKEGLEPADRVEAWEAMFDKYVPLRGFEQVDEFGNEVPSQGTGLGGKGFSIRGKETKAATGRASRASQIIENIVAQRERTLMRAEKNRVAKALLRLVAENPDKQLWEINEVKQKPTVTMGGKSAITDIFTDTPANAPVLEGKKVVYKPVRNQYGDEVVVAKVKGREVLISIKDPVLAEQLQMRDAKDLPPLFAELNVINRALARLWTSLNPVFTVTNYARDIQTAALNALGETNAKVAAKTVAYAAPGGWAMRATISHGMGKDNEGALWFERYRQAGGKTGFLTFATLEDRAKQLENMLKDARGDRTKARQFGAKVIELVEGANAVVENAVRLAAFRAGIEGGMTTAEAASFAKNLTVNFNRRGEWTHFFGALYLFFNPAVQGTARLAQALRRPKVKVAAAGLVAGAFALGVLGRAMGGNDDDDEPYFDKIPTSIKDRNLIIMLPGTKGRYVKIPMPYGYSFFASLGNGIYDAGNTDKSKVKIGADVATAFAMSFNPAGDGMPTVFTPLAQIATNKDRFDRPIMPEQGKYETPKPDSQRFFPSMEGTLLQRTASAVNEATGGNDVRPGLVDVSPESIEHVVSFVTGGLGTAIKDVVNQSTSDEPDATRFPFVKQVIGQPMKDAPANKFYENATEAELAAAEREMYEARGDEAALQAFDAEHGWKMEFSKRSQALRGRLSKLRKQARNVMADETVPREQRVAEKKELMGEINELATDFNRDWNAAKRDARNE